AGTTYYYRVRAGVNNPGGDTSAYTNVVQIIPNQVTIPTAPTGLSQSTSTASAIGLAWTDASNNETGFKVERSTQAATGFTQIGTSTTAIYNDTTGLASATRYYYRVRATNAAGDSGYSNTLTTNTLSLLTATPDNVSATIYKGTNPSLYAYGAKATITYSGGGTGTTFEFRDNADATFTPPGGSPTPEATASKFGFMTVSGGIGSTPVESATYVLNTKAVGIYTGTHGLKEYKNSILIDVKNVRYTLDVREFPAPTGLTATAASASRVNLSWTDNSSAPNNETGFKIERSTQATTGFTEIGTVAANVTTYQNDFSFVAGTTYYYRVRAGVNNPGGDTSAYTNVASIKMNTAPTVVSVTPSSGTFYTGTPYSFNAVYSDADGQADITAAYLFVGLQPNSVYVHYNRTQNKLYIDNGSGFIGGVTPGSSDILEGPNGYLHCAQTTVSGSGNNYTVNWSVRFKPTFTGAKDLTLFAYDSKNESSGWQTKGTITIATATPPAVPTSPFASATDRTKIMVGWTDASSDEEGFKIERGTDGTTFPDVFTSAANTIRFENTGLTPRTKYYYRVKAYKTGAESAPTAVVNSTTFSEIPQVVSLTPTTGNFNADLLSPVPVIFTAVFSDADGAADMNNAMIYINTTLQGGPWNCCYSIYYKDTNKLVLYDDSGTTQIAGTPGSSAVLENSYVRIDCSQSQVTYSGNTLTVKWCVYFRNPFAGDKKVWIQAKDTLNAYSGWVEKANIRINAGPTVDSVTPNSGNFDVDAQTTFTTVVSDRNGANDIGLVDLFFGTTNDWMQSKYHAYYSSSQNKLYMKQDNTPDIGGFAPGSSNIIQTSYGKLYCAATTVVKSGNSVTINWRASFSEAMGGPKNIYIRAQDTNDVWKQSQMGTITVNAPPVLAPIGNKTVNEGANLNFAISATAAGGAAITYSVSSAIPTGATFDATAGTFNWTPTFTQAGSYAVTFVATTAAGSDSETITITVNNVARELYFQYNASMLNTTGFDVTLDQILPGNKFQDFNFRNKKFKLWVDFRLLSTLSYNTGYASPTFTGNSESSIHMNAIAGASYDNEEIGTHPFDANTINAATMLGAGNWLDLSTQPTGNIWLFKDERRDKYLAAVHVHSSRVERAAAVTIAPTFTGSPWAADGYYNTYGDAGYIYVDNAGKLHFKGRIGPTQYGYYCAARPTFIVGIVTEE
ncbi:MAG: fibronectin type III domain-containing protein, partial [Candidatus Omnitrophota bacterium]